ncbi:MAG: sialidase family protein [Rhodospirillaceae bacterium]|nr:sialidase family protein [Rhodospirillaceae bacterium]
MTRKTTLAAATLAGVVFSGCAGPSADPQPPRELAVAAAEGSAQPHLDLSGDGAAILSWLEPAGDSYALRVSTSAGDAWSTPGTVATGDDWFVNWADFPSVTPIAGDVLAAHWLVYQQQGFGYDAVLSLSTDGGATWGEPFLLHTDATDTEHGFVTLFPWQEGLAAVWLDGRNMIVDGEFAFENEAGEPLGMGLRYAQFDVAGERLSSGELDPLACDCCQTDVALLGGDALLAFRDRTTSEVRDIVARRLTVDGWQAPVPLAPDNWVLEACPINGPAIAARDDQVAVAWFSAADNRPLVRVVRSNDGGHTFGDAMNLDSSGSYGHVDIAALPNGETAVSWLRSEADGLTLVLRLIDGAGEIGELITVATIDTTAPLDFPQMVFDGTRLVFAWTDFGESQRVRSAVVGIY